MKEDWVLLVEAFNDVEADIICGMLETNGIPAKKEDRDSLSGAMRVIGGQATEVQVMVPLELLDKARKLLRTLESS